MSTENEQNYTVFLIKSVIAAATSDTSSSSSGADTVTTSRADIKAEFMTDLSGGNAADVETGTVTDINLQLMQEQRLRLRLEERVKSLERQVSRMKTFKFLVCMARLGIILTHFSHLTSSCQCLPRRVEVWEMSFPPGTGRPSLYLPSQSLLRT